MTTLLQVPQAAARNGRPSFDLRPGEITVWRVFLDAGPREMQDVMSILPISDLEAALPLRDPVRQHRFLVARAARRAVLGRYLHTTPQALQFDTGEFGKPTVRCPAGRTPLRFNQSRSAHLTLVAVTCESEIGIDVEQIDPAHADYDVACRCFPTSVLRELLRLPPKLWSAGFFERWTRMEAFVKATGRGLPDTLETDHPHGRGDHAEPHEDGWRLHTYRPAPGFIATVAAEEPVMRLRQCDWPRTWTS
jgi:4'-phosphopantetheinyl transferase